MPDETAAATIQRLEARVRELEEENLRWMNLVGTNPLSDLPNSMMLYKVVLPGELKQALGRPVRFVCMLISLDGLGEINEEYGRAVGDRHIRGIAEFLFEAVSDQERVFHPDGANFALLMLDATVEAGLQRADRLREAILEEEFDVGEFEISDLTCSVGLAVLEGLVPESDTQERIDQLYEELSNRLFRAKRQGGDTTVGSD